VGIRALPARGQSERARTRRNGVRSGRARVAPGTRPRGQLPAFRDAAIERSGSGIENCSTVSSTDVRHRFYIRSTGPLPRIDRSSTAFRPITPIFVDPISQNFRYIKGLEKIGSFRRYAPHRRARTNVSYLYRFSHTSRAAPRGCDTGFEIQ